MKTEDIQLTVKEKEVLELHAKVQAKSKTSYEAIDINFETIQTVIDQADSLIKKQPHLTYADIELDMESFYDSSPEFRMEYKSKVDWEPIYEAKCSNALIRKKRDYIEYLKLQEQFGGQE